MPRLTRSARLASTAVLIAPLHPLLLCCSSACSSAYSLSSRSLRADLLPASVPAPSASPLRSSHLVPGLPDSLLSPLSAAPPAARLLPLLEPSPPSSLLLSLASLTLMPPLPANPLAALPSRPPPPLALPCIPLFLCSLFFPLQVFGN